MSPSTSLAQSPRDALLATDPGGRVAPAVEAEAARLYRQYEPQILRYCRRHLRSREDAEDAVQNTFLRAFGALQRGVEPQLEAAWLYKIAHNVCVSKALSAQRRTQLESPADFQEMEERLAAPGTATALVGGGVAAHDIISRPSTPSSPRPGSTPAPAGSSRTPSAGQSSGLREAPAAASGGRPGRSRGSKVSGGHGSRPARG